MEKINKIKLLKIARETYEKLRKNYGVNESRDYATLDLFLNHGCTREEVSDIIKEMMGR